MKASWEKTEKNQGVLTVETDEKTVAEALDQAFKKVVKKVSVPGFRKGKVPRPIFEKRFGVEALYQDALDILLPEAYEAAVKETGIEPVDRPEIDIEQLEKGKSLIFKATVTVKPEVKLGEYKGLEVEEKDFSVKPEDVDAELERMQKQQGQLEAIEDGAVEKGDRVIIDFEGFVDGEAFEGGKAEKYTLEVGSGTFIPGFEDQLIGMKPGEEKDVEVTFPEDYHAKELAGKPAVFKVKLHEIKRLNLPELDDEFAQDVSEFDTLAELKADIEKNLNEKAQQEKENYIRNELVELAAKNAEIEIPQVMIDHEVEHMLRDFEQRLMYQGLNLEMYAQFTGQDQDALKEQFKEDAEKRVRANLVLEAIAAAEKIEVTEDEIEQEIKTMAEQMGRELEEVRKLVEQQGVIDSVKEQLRVKKTIDLLVSNSKNKA
ncbi:MULTISPECIES: trigger factor [Thermoactinomyces]|jgi:trigger factor|uniref:Trigger factor n=1 Tax=Thermoactinomyces daqus TaxID=1329516 RepID=A0A7W2AGA0_9BACL|nr:MULTISPECIES: trigger factor [Thermoactinomyces]MBA4541426.1 trigger factor [Thermoactinomyces daqus]MBH8596899.1 trigger factor [Thermoactinomyces sp. CICC 10523]MBH8603659.1 trigger factor [Thermoactinomyces sp. CICC 10522]MBH8607690.1 trigger factor [Thermoactinomyces sp. CICC 10521]